MAFKSDKHRRWWFANLGVNGDVGSSKVSDRISAFAFARGSGLSVKESFRMARDSRKQIDFAASPISDKTSAFAFARGAGLSVKESLQMARDSHQDLSDYHRERNDAQIFTKMPSFTAPAMTESQSMRWNADAGGFVMNNDEIQAANRARNDDRIYRNDVSFNPAPSNGVPDNNSGPVNFKHDSSTVLQSASSGMTPEQYENAASKLLDQLDYLNNPPMDYTSEQAAKITSWAERQHDRLSTAIQGLEEGSEKYNELSDLKSLSDSVVKRGKLNAYNDDEFGKSGRLA